MERRRKMILGTARAALIAAVVAASAAGQGAAGRPARSNGPIQKQPAQAPAFEVDPLWPKPMPNHWLLGSAVGVAVDSHDHVFVINLTNSFTARTETGGAANPPIGECCFASPNVLEFDPQGNLVGSWGGPGQGFDWPLLNSGISIDNKDNVWIAGSGGLDGQILQFTHDGHFVRQIGKPAVAPPAPPPDTSAGRGAGRGGGGRGRGRGAPPPSAPPNSSSADAFGGATRVSVDSRANEAYVADGIRNRRVAVVDLTSGAIKRYWGAYGNKPDDAGPTAYSPDAPPSQQFSGVRCAAPSNDGLVYVCDGLNDRIQVFRKDGSFVKEKTIAPKTRGDGSVWDIAFSRDGQQKFLYVADGANDKVYIVDRQSLEILASFGDGGRQPGQFFAVHSIATDSKGNIYTAETYEGKRLQKFVYKGLRQVTNMNRGVVWPGRGGR